MKRMGFLICCALLGCAVGTVPRRRNASADAGRRDVPPHIAALADSSAGDITRRQDAQNAMDGSTDIGARDAGPLAFDAGVDGFAPLDTSSGGGPLDVPPGHIVVASAEYVGGIGANRLSINELFSIGWRFEVPAGTTYRVASFGFHNRGGSGTVFGSIVELPGPEAVPELDAADAPLAPVIGSIDESSPGHVVLSADVELAPGWYAMVFGTDAYGC